MRRSLLSLAVVVLLGTTTAHGAIVFSTDFDDELPMEFSSPGAALEPVQGFAGLGAAGNQFSGSFLRYADAGLLDTQLTLTGLPAHERLTLGFLLAVIDSWDGTELLEVTVDGALVFSQSFALATADTSSYVPPAGGLLSSGTDLGFSAGSFYQHDRAYDMSMEPALADIPHDATSVTITWRVSAVPGSEASYWQGGADESWAIDNVTVAVAGGSSTTTTSSATTSTTTTLPPDPCAGVPDGPTFASIICRLATELARVATDPGVAALRPKLARTLTTGHGRAAEARARCDAGDARRAKARLKQVERAVIQYARRLGGSTARRKLDDELRTTLLAPTGALRNDTRTLRKHLRCPDETAAFRVRRARSSFAGAFRMLGMPARRS